MRSSFDAVQWTYLQKIPSNLRSTAVFLVYYIGFRLDRVSVDCHSSDKFGLNLSMITTGTILLISSIFSL